MTTIWEEKVQAGAARAGNVISVRRRGEKAIVAHPGALPGLAAWRLSWVAGSDLPG